ncbi:acyltransferase [Microbacterium sp. STN6]|nr:acyltransferase [Microbacterium sp. STN6]
MAALVIFDHSYPLGGFGIDPVSRLTHGQATAGSLAVGGFFAISGYLIAKSGLSGDVVQFMWRRVLRIFPGYWTVLIVAAFIVAPIVWTLADGSAGDLFASGTATPLQYIEANWTLKIGTFGIQNIFADTTPYGALVHASVLNGSLWSLIYEWNCYLVIGAAVAFGVLTKARFILPLTTAFFMVAQVVNLTSPESLASIAPFLGDQQRVFLTMTFLLGSCIALYPQFVPYDNRLGALSALVVLGTLRLGGFQTIGTLAAVYLVLFVAAWLPNGFQRVGAKNDYSYGVYIYGFLVQQSLAYFGVTKWGFAPYFLLSLALSAGCAWLSWHLVEKQAMLLKNWGPGHGWAYWKARFSALRTRDVANPASALPEASVGRSGTSSAQGEQ